jgi:hypothetical protein
MVDKIGIKKAFVIVAILATFIPTFFVLSEVGGLDNWEGIPSKGTTDSLYYYARMHEVLDGHPLIGNPYAYEHRSALAPAFFLPDIISAIPMLIGIPFNFGIIVNVFVWSFLFLILAFKALELLRMPRWYAFVLSLLLYVTAYSFMLRPTVMQIVYPMFFAFLIVLIKFLGDPLSRRRGVWLAVASATSFYIYTYIGYIVVFSLAFAFFWYLATRRFKELTKLVISGLFALVLLIPFGINTLLQMKDVYYFETLNRIGLVQTHIPSMEALFYCRWVIIALIAFILFWYFFPKNEESDSRLKIFWLSTGVSLLLGLFLNVFTGVEMTLGIHIGRFVILWMVMAGGVLIYEWYSSRAFSTNKIKYIVVGVFLLLLVAGVVRNIPRGLDFFQFNNRSSHSISDLQALAGPLGWLREHESEESVVWANEAISEYLVVVTKHYPLFAHSAAIHSISSKELEERYLLSQSLNALTIDDLKHDFKLYSGAGSSKELPRVENQKVWFCEKLVFIHAKSNCPPNTDAVALRGEEYFEVLAKQFESVKKNQTALLEQFNVKYLLFDRESDDLRTLSLEKALYDDGRFVIFPLPL